MMTMWFYIQGRKVIIYILLLPLANVLLSIIIVAFSWNTIQGKGIVDPSDIYHGTKVTAKNVHLRLISIQPSDATSYHPLTNDPMEVGSWTIVPIDKLLL